MASSSCCAIGIDGELVRFYQGLPGDVIKGSVNLRNYTKDKTESAKIYLTDFLHTIDGKYIFGPPGKDARTNANWLKLSNEVVTLPPSAKGKVDFVIQIPKDANLNGSYWCVVMVEPISEKSAELAKKIDAKKGELGIQVVTRYSLRIVTSIKGTETKKIKFVEKKVEKNKDNSKTVTLGLENTGNAYFQLNCHVELYDSTGKPAGKFETDHQGGGIYPGCARRFTADVTSVAPGKYTALCVADAGDDNVFGGRYQFDIP
jgi:hypothetical protein